MRKILIAVLLVLLIVLAFFTMYQGISIGSFQILGTGQIVERSDQLDLKIEEANRKIKSDLQNAKSQLSQNVETLLDNKESYYKLANVSTETQISEANTEEIYNIEYLWLTVGKHARNEGVNMRMDVLDGNSEDTNIKDLSFTVVGKYVGIIDFISAIEDDSDLDFRIDNFKMVESSVTTDGIKLDENSNEEDKKKEKLLEATFDVEGVRIKLENTTRTVDDPAEQTEEGEQTTNEVNGQNQTTDNQNNADTTNQVVQ